MIIDISNTNHSQVRIVGQKAQEAEDEIVGCQSGVVTLGIDNQGSESGDLEEGPVPYEFITAKVDSLQGWKTVTGENIWKW